MKKIFVLVLFCIGLNLVYAQTIQTPKIVARQSFYLKDWTITDIKRDTTFNNNTSVATSQAIKDFVAEEFQQTLTQKQ